MRRLLELTIKISLFLFLCWSMAGAQTPTTIPITGNISSVTGNGTPYAGIYVQLANCPSPASIPGYSVIAPTEYQIQANGSGQINSNIWPNDKIDCAGTTGQSQYSVVYVANGNTITAPICYQVTSTQGQWNLNTQQSIACGTTPPNPQDVTYNNVVANHCLSSNGGPCLVGPYVPLNPSASVHVPFTGTYSSSAYNDELSVLSDGADGSAVWVASQGSVGGTSALSGGLKIPTGSAAHQANGVYGFIQNYSPGTTNGVAGYFASLCKVSSLCWGVNPWVSDTVGFPSALYGSEVDVNVNDPGTVGYGVGIVGAWSAQPTGQMQALDIVQPVALSGGPFHWNTGIQIETGATSGNAIYINPLAAGAGQPSQKICLVSVGGSANTLCIFEDSLGGFNFQYQNGATVTMPQPPSTGGFPINAPLVTSGTYTISGCSTSAHIGTGSGGYFNSGVAGTCTVTITPGITAPVGWSCGRPSDITTPANTSSWQETGFSTTTVAFSGTAAIGDQIAWGPCVAF